MLNLLKKRFGEAALQNWRRHDPRHPGLAASRRRHSKSAGLRGGGEERPPHAVPAVTAATTTPTKPSQDAPRAARAPRSAAGRRAVPRAHPVAPLLAEPRGRTLPPAGADRAAPAALRAGYEQLKASRKLTWPDQPGQATVELELEDRTALHRLRRTSGRHLHAFQPASALDASPARRTVSELAEQLQMDDDLPPPRSRSGCPRASSRGGATTSIDDGAAAAASGGDRDNTSGGAAAGRQPPPPSPRP